MQPARFPRAYIYNIMQNTTIHIKNTRDIVKQLILHVFHIKTPYSTIKTYFNSGHIKNKAFSKDYNILI